MGFWSKLKNLFTKKDKIELKSKISSDNTNSNNSLNSKNRYKYSAKNNSNINITTINKQTASNSLKLNKELLNKFKYIHSMYMNRNFQKYNEYIPWIKRNFYPKAFNDAKYVYVDTDVYHDKTKPDFTENDINMMIEEKLIYPLKPVSESDNTKSFAIYYSDKVLYYLILTNKGITFFDQSNRLSH